MKRYIKSAISDILNEGWEIRQELAKDPSTSPRDLAYLATDPSQYTRQKVAHNPSTPADTLRKLAQDPYPAVRFWVDRNPAKPKDLVINQYDLSGVVAFEFLIEELPTNDIKMDISSIVSQQLDRLGYTKVAESYRKGPFPDEDFYYIIQCGQFAEYDDVYALAGDLIETAIRDKGYFVDGYTTDKLLNTGG